MKTCPICGQSYSEPSAVSRADNTTLICSSCGIREAVAGLLKPKKVEEIVAKNCTGVSTEHEYRLPHPA